MQESQLRVVESREDGVTEQEAGMQETQAESDHQTPLWVELNKD